MAKYRGPVCKLCRREGEKLFLKGARCFTPKCAFERRGYAPVCTARLGSSLASVNPTITASCVPSRKRAARLRYIGAAVPPLLRGIPQTSWSDRSQHAAAARNPPGQCDLPARVCSQPRGSTLLVTHGHFSVNNRRTDVPSMLLGAGDEVTVRTESRRRTFFKGLADIAETRTLQPGWIGI